MSSQNIQSLSYIDAAPLIKNSEIRWRLYLRFYVSINTLDKINNQKNTKKSNNEDR